MSRRNIVFIVVGVLIVVVAGFWYWSKNRQAPSAPFFSGSTSESVPQTSIDQKTADISLGSQIFERTQNPLKGKLPPTNPFEKNETNPLRGVYQNPF